MVGAGGEGLGSFPGPPVCFFQEFSDGGQNELEGIVGVNLGVWSMGVANYAPAPPPLKALTLEPLIHVYTCMCIYNSHVCTCIYKHHI